MANKNTKFSGGGANTQFVWYASYGSNMNADRFACYIAGGTPRGALCSYDGCDDKRLPITDAAIELPFPLYFAGETHVWTGGAARIGLTNTGASTKGRAYLITVSQFEQVVAQESWRKEPANVDIARLRRYGHMTIGSGNYDEAVYCGERDGYPVLSFTSPEAEPVFAKPAPAYLRTIAAGLQESHGLNAQMIAKYLVDKPGVRYNYTYNELLSSLVETATTVAS